MDRRLEDIVEGAGLEESRINTDFKDWLTKWGGPLLFAILALALTYRGYIWWKGKKIQNLDSAFIELDDASAAGNPAGLIQISRDWAGQGSVPLLARLEAADRLLMAATIGVKPGGDPANEDDLLTREEINNNLDQADRLFKEVYESTQGNTAKVLMQLRSLSGMGSVLVSKSDMDGGLKLFDTFIALAEENGMKGLADSMRDRLKELAADRTPAPMVPEADIYAIKAALAPATDDEGFLTPDQLLNELGPVPPAGPAVPEETTTPDPGATEKPAPDAAPAQPEQAPAESEPTPEKKPPSAGG
jgi:hypothetical protein